MRNPGGYATIQSDGGIRAVLDRLRCEEISGWQWECDTFTCFHCNTVIHVKPMADPADMGGLCKLCMKLICPKCVGGACVPFERKVEEAEAKERERILRGY